MDPEYVEGDEEDEEAQAMAAAMGFSSFGSHKQPTKKRKFNSTTDAFVDGQQLASLDKGGKKGQGSGGNTVPLGKTRVFGALVTTTKPLEVQGAMRPNAEEIVLGEDELEDGPNYVDTSFPPPMEREEDGPNYIDTSLPPPSEAVEEHGSKYVETDHPPSITDEEAEEMQARIDALLASIDSQQSEPLLPSESGARPTHHELPEKSAFSDTALSQGGARSLQNPQNRFSDTASVASSSRPSERGQRNPTWFIGYYDPSFNENPWAILENELGLEPLGKWPDKQGTQAVK
jgi:hypothetical protein